MNTPNPVIGLDDTTKENLRAAMQPAEEMVGALTEAPRRGRKPATPAPAMPDALPEGAEERLNQSLDVARKVDAAVQSIAARQFECAKMVGQMQAFNMFKHFAGTADLVLMRQMKESKAYKGMQVPQADGSTLTISTFEEFCELMGTSRRKVDEDIQNLNVFGEAFMDAAQKMGLGYRDLRKLRALPEDAQTVVIEGETLGDDPEALKDKLLEMASQKAKTEEALKEAKKDHDAQGRVLANKNTALDKAQTELAKMLNIPPDEQVLLRGAKENNAVRELHSVGLGLIGYFTKYLATATAILESEELSQHAAEKVTSLTSGLCTEMADSLLEAGIDIDFRILTYPPHLGDLPLRGNVGTTEEPEE